MSSEAYIVAVFNVNKDKVDDFQSAIDDMIKNVWEKEKETCSRYEWTRDTSNPTRFVMIETYASEKDAKEHGQTPYFNAFASQIEPKGWLAEPPNIIVTNGIKGFNSREKGLW